MEQRKIIRPEGMELIRYINDGYPICNSCGALMYVNDPKEVDYFECPACGLKIDFMEYEYKSVEEADLAPGVDKIIGDEPEGCSACGGPYPSCKTSCPVFDD